MDRVPESNRAAASVAVFPLPTFLMHTRDWEQSANQVWRDCFLGAAELDQMSQISGGIRAVTPVNERITTRGTSSIESDSAAQGVDCPARSDGSQGRPYSHCFVQPAASARAASQRRIVSTCWYEMSRNRY